MHSMQTSRKSDEASFMENARERLLRLRMARTQVPKEEARGITARASSCQQIPLSYSQERLWFLDQMGLVGDAYNIPLALRLVGKLVEPALTHALREVVRRHESLRTHFRASDGVSTQVIDRPESFQPRKIDLG